MARTAGVISALFLACLSVYCFVQYYSKTCGHPTFATVTFAVSALYGILVGLNEVNDVGGSLRKHVDMLEDTVVLPCLCTEVWLAVGVIPKEAAWFHSVAALVPVMFHLVNRNVNDDFVYTLELVSVVSLIVAGVMGNNSYAVGAGSAYGVGRFSFRRGENCMGFDCTDMYNYALCAFVLCALAGIKCSA